MMHRAVWVLSLAALASAFLAGCGYADHPLSDEKTSVADARLIGAWDVVDETGEALPSQRLTVGRSAEHPNGLEVVGLGWDEEGHVVVQRAPLYTIALDDNRFASLDVTGKGAWVMALYELSDEGDTLWVHQMDVPEIVAAIREGRLAGEILEGAPSTSSGERPDESSDEGPEEAQGPPLVKALRDLIQEVATKSLRETLKDNPVPHVTASTEELVAFVRKHGKDLFVGRKDAVRLVRVARPDATK